MERLICILFLDMNECSPNLCQNGATCVDLVGSYRCDCKPGYTGNNCQTGNKRLLLKYFEFETFERKSPFSRKLEPEDENTDLSPILLRYQ